MIVQFLILGEYKFISRTCFAPTYIYYIFAIPSCIVEYLVGNL